MHNSAGRPPRPPPSMPFPNPAHSGTNKPNQMAGKQFQPAQPPRFPRPGQGPVPGPVPGHGYVLTPALHAGPMQFMTPAMGYAPPFMVPPGAPPMIPVPRPVSPMLPASVGIPSSASSAPTSVAGQQTTASRTRQESTSTRTTKITLKNPDTGEDLTEEVFSPNSAKTMPRQPAQPPSFSSGSVYSPHQTVTAEPRSDITPRHDNRSSAAQTFLTQVHDRAGVKRDSHGSGSQSEESAEVLADGKSKQSDKTTVGSLASCSDEKPPSQKAVIDGSAAENGAVPLSPLTVGSATESVSIGDDRSLNENEPSESLPQAGDNAKSSQSGSKQRSQKASKKRKEMLKKKEDAGVSDDLLDSFKDKPKAGEEAKTDGEVISEPSDKERSPQASSSNGTVDLKSVSPSDEVTNLGAMPETAVDGVFEEEPAGELTGSQEAVINSNGSVQKKTLVGDIKYSPGQWTPDNPDGKMAYSRDFLLQFQSVDEMPYALPSVDCVSAKAHHNLPGPPPRDFFLPTFVSSGGSRPAHGNRRNSSRSGMPAQQQAPRHKVIHLIPDVAPLQKGENRWTRSSERVNDADQDKDTIIAMQKVRGILNKLTPQNCDKLIGQMKELPINNEERLQGCIDLCFEKAVLEPTFSTLYAKFCHVFMQMKVPVSADAKETVSFRKLLLTKCQREFEKDKSEEQWREELQTAVGEAKTEEEAKAKKEELELQVMLAKKRSLGNIRFIGELFKLKMLTESIMHECLVKLLRAADEESLECLSRLLTTVGKLLDHDKAKPRMVQYFEQIKRIIDLNRVPPRIKFMLQDLMELRQNGWVPRHADNNPKTLDQIHREIQEEQQQMKLEQKQAELMRKESRPVRPGRGSGGRVNEDGWQMAGSRGMRISTDPTQLKGVSARLADGAKRDADLQLGPGGKSFASWGRGSSGGASGGARGAQSAVVTTGSRYASLSGAPEAPRSLDRRPPPNRGGSGGALPRQNSRGNVPSSPMRRSASISTPGTPTRHTAKPGREEALQLARQLSSGGLTRSSTEKKHDRDAQTPQPAADLLSQAEVEKKTEALIKEYLSVRDLKEAKQCVLELQSPGQHHNVVLTILNSCIDRKAEDRTQAGQLLLSLTQEQVLSSEQCHAGIQDLLEFAVDMEIDIPHVWKYLAALVGPLVAEGFCQLDRLVSVESLQSSKKGGVFAAAILSDVVQKKGERVACERWLDSRLAWNSLLPEGRDVEEFVKDKGVAFTCKPTLPFLVAQKASSDKLISFIERTYSEEERAQPAFLRMLVREIIQSCIQKKGNDFVLVKGNLVRHEEVFGKFLDDKTELHVAVVLELEAVWNGFGQPRNLLIDLFTTVHEILGENNGFLDWEKVADKERGHGVAITTTRKFLEWLRNEASA